MSAQPNKSGNFSGYVGWQQPKISYGIQAQKPKPQCEIPLKELQDSTTTGVVTINGEKKYCRWEITGCTEADLIKALSEDKLLFVAKTCDQPSITTATATASHNHTVNGVVISQSNKSASVSIVHNSPAILYSFADLRKGGEQHLYVSSTPFAEAQPFVKVLDYAEFQKNMIENAYPELKGSHAPSAKK